MVTRDTCLVFYPSGYEAYDGLLDALCTDTVEEGNVEVYDYTLQPDQSYYYLSYGDKMIALLDSSMHVPQLPSEMNEAAMRKISDYLRYSMKASGNEQAYSIAFLEQSYYKNIGNLEFTYALVGDALSVYCKQYDFRFQIPLNLIGEDIGIAVT